jgi:hypothetical protein
VKSAGAMLPDSSRTNMMSATPGPLTSKPVNEIVELNAAEHVTELGAMTLAVTFGDAFCALANDAGARSRMVARNLTAIFM